MAAFKSSLVLGQLVHPDDIAEVKALANIDLPCKLADRKLNKYVMSRYKMQGVLQQMEGIINGNKPKSDKKKQSEGQEETEGNKQSDGNEESDGPKNDGLDSLRNEIKKIEKNIAKAAENLVEVTITAYEAKKKFRLKKGEKIGTGKQNRISMNIESPVDFTLSNVAQFPIAYDGLEFDVQYFRNEQVDDSNDTTVYSGAGSADAEKKGTGDGSLTKKKSDNQSAQTAAFKKKIGDFISTFLNQGDDKEMNDSEMTTVASDGESLNHSRNVIQSVNESMTTQTNMHVISGTLVIVARCTHKNADIMSPCLLDSGKLMTAWNYTYPKDPIALSYKKSDLFEFVFGEEKNPPKPDDPALHLLTGCTRYSSFVGMAHILKTETSQSTQASQATATSVKRIIEKEQVVGNRTGTTGERMKKAAAKCQKMLSTAQIFNHCSLVTLGIIPNIAASDITTTVKSLDMSPGAQLEGLNAIQTASQTAVNDMSENSNAENKKQAKTGAEFVSKNNDFAQNTVSEIADKESEANKVIDTNSLMTAFTDYITKAQAGECGVPSTFFIQKINRYDVAKAYLRTLYPTSADAGAEGQDGLKATGGYNGQFT